jgi:AcrR family transcriptional regulator
MTSRSVKDESAPVRRRRKEARPTEIIDAAMAEFTQNGFAGARLTDVAERAGISHGTIYNYFDSKETLFRALFRSRLVESLDAAAFASVLGATSAPQMLRLALKTAFSELAGSDALALIRILLVESERFPDLVRECRNEVFGKMAFMLRMLLEQGVARGELVPGTYQNHVNVLLSPVIVAALFGPISGSESWKDEAEQDIDAFLDAVLTGIASPA